MRILEPTDEMLEEWEEWLKSRPPQIAEVARCYPPWELFRMGSGHRCTVHSYGELEDGTVSLTVSVTGEYNFVAFDRNVFGIDPDELAPCSLPATNEVLGTAMLDETKITEWVQEHAK